MTTDRATRAALLRPARGRVLTGVAQGLADHLGLSAQAMRWLFVLAALAGGAGLVAYGFLWAFVPEGEVDDGSTGGPAVDPGARGREVGRWVVVAGLVAAAVGAAVLLGIDLGVSTWAPLVVVGAGAAFAWSRLDDTARRRWVPEDPADRSGTVVRVGAGVALAVVGLLLLTTRDLGTVQVWNVVVAVLVTLVGVAVIVAPYATRLWGQLRTEQAARIRATERADIAAHLHDSVLQTLTLIQRRSDDPQVTALARAQERELRQWLFSGPREGPASLASAVTAVVHEVEDRHGTPVDLVLTGDHPLDEGAQALIAALREALVNAATHGAPPVSAYVEVGPAHLEAFVRDHGPGFDLRTVPPDRLGVRESILSRMERHGGEAAVRRLEDGTEVSLRLPVRSRTAEPADPTSQETRHD